jgi:hypothetical protein
LLVSTSRHVVLPSLATRSTRRLDACYLNLEGGSNPTPEPEPTFRGPTVHHVAKYSTCVPWVAEREEERRSLSIRSWRSGYCRADIRNLTDNGRINRSVRWGHEGSPCSLKESLGGPRRELEPTRSYSSLFPPALTRANIFRSRRRRRRGNRVCVCEFDFLWGGVTAVCAAEI